jgi:hypothetical protein
MECASTSWRFVTDPKLRCEVMTGKDAFGLYVHSNNLWLFALNNLMYQQKEVPKLFRAILAPARFSN